MTRDCVFISSDTRKRHIARRNSRRQTLAGGRHNRQTTAGRHVLRSRRRQQGRREHQVRTALSTVNRGVLWCSGSWPILTCLEK